MKTVHKIIELHGGLAALNPAGPGHINIENEPYMRLVIEHAGTGPGGKLPLISVAHYGEQNGDVMRDPEMTFEVDFEGWSTATNEYERMVKERTDSGGVVSRLLKSVKPKLDDFWHPISFRNDYMGVCQEGDAGAVFLNDEGKVMIRPKLIRELRQFARTWDRNIKEQGFLEAYLRTKSMSQKVCEPESEPESNASLADPPAPEAATAGWRKAWLGSRGI